MMNKLVILSILCVCIYGKKSEVSIVLGGDVAFGGLTRYLVKTNKCRYEDTLIGIKSESRGADLLFLNLENSIGDPDNPPKPTDPDKIVTLIAEVQSVKAFKALNVSAVSIGNNHIMDNGAVGVKNTINILKKNNIKYSGLTYGKKKYNTQKPVIFEVNGIKVGLLSYCMDKMGCEDIRSRINIGTALFQRMHAIKDHVALKEKVDVILSYIHWQDEYTNQPANLTMVDGVIDAIASYADVIVGSHQHVTSGHYYFRKTLVLNGLGNLHYPMHMSPFNEFDEKSHPLKKLEKWWYKMTKNFKNPSAVGKLVKLVFNKTGLIRRKAMYEYVSIIADKRRCLKTVKDKESEWQRICSHSDDKCLGDSKCNTHECDV